MKSLKKDKMGKAPIVPILAVALIVLALIVAVSMFGGEPAPATVTPGVAVESGDVTLSFTNLNGSSVGTLANMTVYLTSAGVYNTYADAYDAIDTDGGLVSPYDASKVSSAKSGTPDSSGQVTFSIVGTKYDSTDPVAYPGTDFGLVALSSTGTNLLSYNPLVGKLKVTSHLNLDETAITKVIEGLDGYLGSTIEVAPKGVISFYDSQSGSYARTGYYIDTADNASTTDSDFEVAVRLNPGSDKTVLQDVGIYVEELDSTRGTGLLTLDDVELYINGVKQTGVSLTKTADLDSGSAAKKNAPTANTTGTSTMWYVEGGEFDISRTNTNNLDEVIVKLVDYDVDLSATTNTSNDQACVRFIFVPFNAHKDSDLMTAVAFILTIGEIQTGGYV